MAVSLQSNGGPKRSELSMFCQAQEWSAKHSVPMSVFLFIRLIDPAFDNVRDAELLKIGGRTVLPSGV